MATRAEQKKTQEVASKNELPKMLKNEHLFAEIGVDTAENEPDVQV